MLAHFAGNMRKDIALPGKIDAKHRPGQNLRHGAFSDDLFFFRHRAANIPRQRTTLKTSTSQGAAVSNPLPPADLEIVPNVGVEKLLWLALTGIARAKGSAGIPEAPRVSTTRRCGEARPRL